MGYRFEFLSNFFQYGRDVKTSLSSDSSANYRFLNINLFFTNKSFMKQKLFGAAAMVALILTATSCNDQKQSEFNFDSVKQEVTISARVTYNAGVEIDSTNPSGYKIINARPAVGRKVFIEIDNSEYQFAAPAGVQGTQIFEAVTDGDGVFTITVPTKSTGVNATLRLEEFTAIHREYVKMENGKPVFKTQIYSYRTPAGLAVLNLKPGAFSFPDNNDLEYEPVPLEVEEYNENVTISGNVNLAYETGFRQGAFKTASKANVEFELEYADILDPATALPIPLTFGTTTDANGHYTITLPMKTLSEGFTINSIKVLGIGDQQFEHWINDTVKEIVSGAYKTANNDILAVVHPFNDVVDGITYDLGTKNLVFRPYYNDNITAIPQPENWSDDLIGWAAGRSDLGFDETYNKIATLTGKVYMPYLEAYGEAAYRNERQTIVLTGAVAPYDNGLVVITEADGSFTVDLPVADENPIAFDIELEKKDQPFEFKGSKAAKDVMLYDGLYGDGGIGGGNIIQIKADGTEWYELGDFYVKYNPAVGNTPDEWNPDLIGWYRDAVYKKINPDKKVKAQLLFAYEKSYGIGDYKAMPFIVTIDIDDDNNPLTPGRSIAVKPDANGNIEFDLPLQDELDQPDLSIAAANDVYNYKEYVHYKEYGKNDTRLIADDYTLYVKADFEKDPEWNQDLGIRFYKFAQLGVPGVGGIPSTFHKNLAGWYKKIDGDNILYGAEVLASGTAKLAYETAYMTGDWKAAEGVLVNLTIDRDPMVPGSGDKVEVLSDDQGNFKFNVPVKREGFKRKIEVGGGDNIPEDNFTHYTSATEANNTQVLSGEYAGTSVANNDDPEWFDMGTVYYTFTPSAEDKPDMWDNFVENLYGWKFIEGYNVKTAVKGTFKIAKETGARIGTFTGAPYMPVIITCGGVDYTGVTNDKGQFEVKILQKYAGDEANPGFKTTVDYESELFGKFEHYRKVGTKAIDKLEGKYQHLTTSKDPALDWKQLGTIYYEFDPTAAAIAATNDWNTELAGWTSGDLAGWNAPAYNQTELIYVQCDVKKCVEENSGAPKAIWATLDEAATADVTVVIGGANKTYKAPVVGGSINLPLYVVEVPGAVTITVSVDDVNCPAFEHWTGATTSQTITGKKFKSEDNIAAQPGVKDGNNFKPAHSAKMKLDLDGMTPPANWTIITSKSNTTED